MYTFQPGNFTVGSGVDEGVKVMLYFKIHILLAGVSCNKI